MRAPSIVLTSVLCISSAVAVQGFLIRSQEVEDEEALAELSAIDSDIDVDVGAAHGSLTGKLLVAAPGLEDSYFAGTVIYMLADDDDGSLGVVLNRPRGAVVHGGALAHLWDGGPVGRDRVFVLHDDLRSTGSVVINGVAVAAEPSILDDVMEGNGPERARVFVGYAGWGPGQLDHELDEGAWLVADGDARLVLTDDTNTLVRDAYAKAQRPNRD
jgi:putative transcriptional regulator